MGILITSTVAHSSVKPKRVRISEDEALNWGNTTTSTGHNANGLVRRNAIRGRWLRRRYPHNPSPAEPSTGNTTAGMAPPGLPTDYSDLEGMSLPELEERANELRRTLGMRHNIHIDIPPGLGDWPSVQRGNDSSSRGNDNNNTGDVEVVRQHSNDLLEDQRAQSLMFEIRRRIGQDSRRRVRALRSRNIRVPAVGTTTTIQPQQQHRHQPREPLPLQRPSSPPLTAQSSDRPNNIDEYDALIQGTEPSENWRNRAFRIHRGGDETPEESDATRRERNRHAFVTSMVEEEEEESSSFSQNDEDDPVELPFDFGIE